ncbi:PREDICTED: mutant gag-pol poly [Prunus dulcis]|uniref:PREDICTED: mutant gag-pol poly n=1 Tax=Prunus dulcis TaxID=3755 RepID=A0A5E4GDI8_PRUDU|nr:PREDICTED: mutant gag-pol poly [Prunus dulcis]
MVSTRNQRKASREELLGPLLVHQKPRSKRDIMTRENKQDTSSDGDCITKLEQQVENLSASILKLMESLKTGKPSRPSTSYEPDQKLKKKVVKDSEDEDDTQVDPTKKEAESGDNKNSIDTLKIDFKVDIPIYKGDVDPEKLDNWIDTLETYFTVYKYSNVQKIKFASLKLSSHALTWWKSYERRYDVSELTWKNFKMLFEKIILSSWL